MYSSRDSLFHRLQVWPARIMSRGSNARKIFPNTGSGMKTHGEFSQYSTSSSSSALLQPLPTLPARTSEFPTSVRAILDGYGGTAPDDDDGDEFVDASADILGSSAISQSIELPLLRRAPVGSRNRKKRELGRVAKQLPTRKEIFVFIYLLEICFFSSRCERFFLATHTLTRFCVVCAAN